MELPPKNTGVEAGTGNNKRFPLQKEKFVEERLRAVQECVTKLKQENPEVLSFCTFGSTTKGRAKEESDIDGYLFVDASGAEGGASGDKTSTKLMKDLEGHPTEEISAEEFADSADRKYVSGMREYLKEKLRLTDKQVEHVRSLPISKEIIDKHLQNLIKQIETNSEYEKALAEWGAANQESKPAKSELDELVAYWSGRPKKPPLPQASLNLYSMFHLDIGGGIKPLRKYLIDQLNSRGQKGEKAWEEIIGTTEDMEEGFKRNAGKRFPRTLKEASDVYNK